MREIERQTDRQYRDKQVVKILGTELEKFNNFKYLGVIVKVNGGMNIKMKHRIHVAWCTSEDEYHFVIGPCKTMV